MARHTQGPWYASIGLDLEHSAYGNIGPIRNEQCGKPFATLLNSFDTYPPRVLEANALLIAAAPDLLAALDGLLAHHVVYESRSDTLQDRIDFARAAIRKARGV